MVAAMPYRGPDGNGHAVVAPHCGLAHVRLAILDLSAAAAQPFSVDGGRFVLSYNGEIFNYVELRDELSALGHRFSTTSDTEVLVRAYEQWGEGCVSRFEGMWAFALYDRPRDRLFCSRDRFGIKPFVYAEHGGRLLFASNVRAILSVEPSFARPNWDALSLSLRASHDARLAETCFQGVHRLPPAHNLILERGGKRIVRYWGYPQEIRTDISLEAAAEELRALLLDSMRLRMRSDVPVGSTVSGGLDSCVLMHAMRESYTGPHDAFTASWPGEPFDETEAARQMLEPLGIRHHTITVPTFDVVETMTRCVEHLESPNPCPAVLPLWHIMAALKTKATVAIEGQGSDELLGGHPLFYAPYAAMDQLRAGHPLAALTDLRTPLRTNGAASVALNIGRVLAPGFHDLYRRLRGDENVYAGPLLGGPDRIALPTHDAATVGHLNRTLHIWHSGELLDLLHYGDAISMAHSVESRLPFLAHPLVEFAFRLPGWMKISGGVTRLVLRRAAAKIVPAPVLTSRKKLGFVTPISRWYRERPRQTIDPILRTRACRERGIFEPRALDRALDAHRQGLVDLGPQIYRWAAAELWFRTFIDRAPTR